MSNTHKLPLCNKGDLKAPDVWQIFDGDSKDDNSKAGGKVKVLGLSDQATAQPAPLTAFVSPDNL